ncbi:hypothetical protein AB0J48_35335 [Nocardia salmonicida]|uniref:hypothetical protein n=1 Tax=Nocardia salmonicida TaxID=53431 RepID=UPI0034183436
MTGFAAHLIEGYPLLPAWIQWIYDHNPGTAQMMYEFHYPPIDTDGNICAWVQQPWWNLDRMFRTEHAARQFQRGRLSGRCTMICSPELPDDDAFIAAAEARQQWAGRWYSRDEIGSPDWAPA